MGYDTGFTGCHGGFGMLSTVTYPMLIDELADFEILHEPRDKRRSFKWVTSRHGLSTESLFSVAETLFVCSERSGVWVHEQQPDAFMLVTVEQDLPEWVSACPDSVLVVRSPRHDSLLQRLQMFFIRRQAASHALEKGILSVLPIETVFIEAHDFVGGTLVIASKTHPMRSYKPSSLEATLLARLYAIDDAEEEISLDPIDFQSSRYFTLVKRVKLPEGGTELIAAAFRNRPASKGQQESFNLFAKRIEMALRHEETDVNFEAGDTGALMTRLINGSYISRLWLEAFEAKTGISEKSDLRLLGADLTGLSDRERARLCYLIDKSFSLIASSVLSGNRYLFLLHSETADGALSNNTLQETIDTNISPEFKVSFAASQVYEQLRDTHFANREIELVLGYSSFVDVANQFVASNDEGRCFYSFEDCFLYALVDSNSMDPTFKDFCLSHTILEKLYNEDEVNGTENVRILIMYQFYARRASIVAEKLHMHRNTVLYHIDKIQKRFNIDLEDPGIQERLMLDSKALFKRLAYTPNALDEFLAPAKRLK